MSKRDKKRFVKFCLDGQCCIVTPEEAVHMREDEEDPGAMTEEDVWMTEEEFEALPEFQGF